MCACEAHLSENDGGSCEKQLPPKQSAKPKGGGRWCCKWFISKHYPGSEGVRSRLLRDLLRIKGFGGSAGQ